MREQIKLAKRWAQGSLTWLNFIPVGLNNGTCIDTGKHKLDNKTLDPKNKIIEKIIYIYIYHENKCKQAVKHKPITQLSKSIVDSHFHFHRWTHGVIKFTNKTREFPAECEGGSLAKILN